MMSLAGDDNQLSKPNVFRRMAFVHSTAMVLVTRRGVANINWVISGKFSLIFAASTFILSSVAVREHASTFPDRSGASDALAIASAPKSFLRLTRNELGPSLFCEDDSESLESHSLFIRDHVVQGSLDVRSQNRHIRQWSRACCWSSGGIFTDDL